MAKPPTDCRFAVMMTAAEKQIIEWALSETEWSVQDAAALLGIEKSGIYKRMRTFGIPTLKQQQEQAEEAQKCQDSSSTESPTPSPD